MDFVFDALGTGRRIKCLKVVDDSTREAVDILVGARDQRHSCHPGIGRDGAVPRLRKRDPYRPGSGFTGKALDQWPANLTTYIGYVRPGYIWYVPLECR